MLATVVVQTCEASVGSGVSEWLGRSIELPPKIEAPALIYAAFEAVRRH
jgi:hypothetical protein